MQGADAVMMLRIQRERHGEVLFPSLQEYAERYCLTTERLQRAKSGVLVMHPGPMNRGVEIDPRVADSAAALVTDQVRAGLVVRMAVLYDLVAQRPVRDSRAGEGARENREVPSALTGAPEAV